MTLSLGNIIQKNLDKERKRREKEIAYMKIIMERARTQEKKE